MRKLSAGLVLAGVFFLIGAVAWLGSIDHWSTDYCNSGPPTISGCIVGDYTYLVIGFFGVLLLATGIVMRLSSTQTIKLKTNEP